jgi:hypothetical protein
MEILYSQSQSGQHTTVSRSGQCSFASATADAYWGRRLLNEEQRLPVKRLMPTAVGRSCTGYQRL